MYSFNQCCYSKCKNTPDYLKYNCKENLKRDQKIYSSFFKLQYSPNEFLETKKYYEQKKNIRINELKFYNLNKKTIDNIFLESFPLD